MKISPTLEKSLALSLALLLTACGSNSTSSPEPNSSSPSAVTPSPSAVTPSPSAVTPSPSAVTPSPSAVSDLDVHSGLISDLFYRDQIAAGDSKDELFEFQAMNSYPGFVNYSLASDWYYGGGNVTPFGVPDLTTLRLDPTWVVPSSDCLANNDLGGPPKGTTYILAVEDQTGKRQLHVTILDARAYYFQGFDC